MTSKPLASLELAHPIFQAPIGSVGRAGKRCVQRRGSRPSGVHLAQPTQLWESAGRPVAPNRPGEGEMVARRADGTDIPRYFFGSPTSDIAAGAEAMALYAGEAVGLVRRASPAAVIVAELAAGLRV